MNGGKKLLSKLRNVVRNYVEGQRERKQGWKAGGGMMRLRARLGEERKTEDLETNRRRKRQGRVQASEGEG